MRFIFAAILAAWCSFACAASGTFTANGNLQGQNIFVPGPAYIQIKGTWGGGTVVVQVKGADGTWRDITNTSTTADADLFLDFTSETYISLTLTGATTPSIYWEVRGNRR